MKTNATQLQAHYEQTLQIHAENAREDARASKIMLCFTGVLILVALLIPAIALLA